MSECTSPEPISLHKRLAGGRVECPKCKRKGLGYAAHPHAFGWKDYGKASCRYCRGTFSVVAKKSG